LLGSVQNFTRDLKVDRSDELQTRMGLFFNDQWRITRKLTLNLGVRWEFFSPISGNKPGGLTNLDLLTGEVLFSDVGKVNSSAGLYTYYKNFGPRAGIAYLVNPKTVIRTGYGRSFGLGTGGSNFGSMSQRWPNTASQDATASTLYISAFPLSDGPPTAPLILKAPDNGRLLLPDKVGFIGFYFDNKFDYIDAW